MLKKGMDEMLENLTNDELIQINDEFNQEFVSMDALLRVVGEEVFGKAVNMAEMMLVITHSAKHLAKRLKYA